MSLFFKEHILNSTLLVWNIEETEAELAHLVNHDDIEATHSFTSPRRRIERLASRAALRQVDNTSRVCYSPIGQPELIRPPHSREVVSQNHISISHTLAKATVLLSDKKCAVDIENMGRDISRLHHKFISPREEKLTAIEGIPTDLMIWCAKEAMYKYASRKELDFLTDLEVLNIDKTIMALEGRTGNELLRLQILPIDDHIIVYII